MSDDQFLRLITRLEDLPPILSSSVAPDEMAFIRSLESKGFLPFAVTPFYASLAKGDRSDPIRRQFFPDPREAERSSCELDDPLGEASHRAAPRLVHQYRDRALLLANGVCAGYCRHCFRRVWTGEEHGFIEDAELGPIVAYLESHDEIREILISGGDPLFASDDRLEDLFLRLRSARPGVLLRVCSRVPVVAPARLNPSLLSLLHRFKPLRLVIHLNHPREFAPEVRAALLSCVDAGLPVHTQTVLLRGVNDDAAVLADLFRSVTDLGATPYYLFQGDLAPGTAHLRVPLKRGLEIYAELKKLVSGLCLPTYAVDLPGGGGKIALHPDSIGERIVAADGGRFYLLKDADGRLWRYPEE